MTVVAEGIIEDGVGAVGHPQNASVVGSLHEIAVDG